MPDYSMNADDLGFSKSTVRPIFTRYAIALLCIAVAFLFRWLLDSLLSNNFAFLTLYGGVAAAVWFSGWRSATLSALAGFIFADYCFVAPRYQFVFTKPVLAGLVGYSVSCGLIIFLGEVSRRARDRAEQQKELLATTLTSMGDGVIVTDASGTITSLNGEAERLTGWTNAQAVGKAHSEIFRIVNEYTRQPADNPIENALRTGTVTGLANHTILLTKDGREIPIDDSAAPIRKRVGDPLGVVLVFRDVTEQRRAQKDQARLAEIVKYSGDAIITKDLNGVINSWNESAKRLFGYEAEEVVGKPATVLFPRDRLQEEDYILGRLRQGQTCERLETIRVRKDGTPIHVSVNVSPLKNGDGEIIGASKVIHDVSELVAAREGLMREKELLATTLASIGDGVILTDEQGRVTFLNSEAEKLTGWNTDDARGRPLNEVFKIVNEQTRATVENPVEKVMRLGGVVGLANHTILIAKDGREIPIDDSAAPIRQSGGPMFGIVLVFRDFTEQKQLEQSLRESESLKSVDLEAMMRLHEVGALCAGKAELDECLNAIVKAAITVTQAAKGNLQLLDAESRNLMIAAQLGFDESFTTYFDRVTAEDQPACGAAMNSRKRVIVQDVKQSEIFVGKPSLDVMLSAGVRAVQSTPLISSSGNLLGMISTHFAAPHRPGERELRFLDLLARQAADYLERQRHHEELREREERFRTMANSAPVLIWISNPEKLCTWFNKQWLDFTGRTMQQEIGNGWAEGVHPDDFDRCLKTYVDSFDARQAFTMEYRLRRHDGEWRWILDHGVPIYEADNIFAGYIGSCIDVTDRKRAEGALRERTHELESLLDVLPVAVWTASDPECRDIRGNQFAQELFCVPKDANVSQTSAALQAAFEIPHFRDGRRLEPHELPMQRAATSGEPQSDQEIEVQIPDGRRVMIRGSSVPLKDDHGKLRGVLGAFVDVTTIKQAEAERERLLRSEQELRQLAEEANRLKDEFLAIMSHELRNPLNVILGYSELLLRSEQIAEAPHLHRLAEAIKRNAVSQSKLIRDLLDLSRLRSGKLELNNEVVSFTAAIHNAIDTVRADVEAKNIALEVVAPDEALLVEGDSVRLEQIIWNLLNNSVKFTPPGGRIAVHAAKDGNQLSLSVEDSGQGIDPSFLPHVFEMFRQADSGTSRLQTGMGVGLAVVKQLVDLHKGSISASSEGRGKGAKFTIKLPLSVETQLQPSPVIDLTTLDRLAILVVDDSEDTTEMLALLLKMSGAIVTAATSGDEALRMLSKKQFDVVLSDISMPGMDGFEFLRRLRDLPSRANVPVLALTGFGRPEDIDRAHAEGFFAHVTKPFELEALMKVLQRLPKRQ